MSNQTHVMPLWVRWYSIRHQDGRRASGIGYNKSLWHIAGDQWETDWRTLCGREAQIIAQQVETDDPYTTPFHRGDNPANHGKCYVCMRIQKGKSGG